MQSQWGNGEAATIAAGSEAVLVLDDEPNVVSVLRLQLKGLAGAVYTATDGQTALDLLAAHPEIAVAIIDQRMPGMNGAEFIAHSASYPNLLRIILTAYQDIGSLIDAINAGSIYRYVEKPWKKEDLIAIVRQALEIYRLRMENRRLQLELQQAKDRQRDENIQLNREANVPHMVGSSRALRTTLEQIRKIAPMESSVFIIGETGTGKELVAKAIHYNSPRAGGAFVAVNCGALTPSLLMSELFGYGKGATPDAKETKEGLFDAADNGTLFLDELGEASEQVQASLLRVLQEREFLRVGGTTPVSVDVRILAATTPERKERIRSELLFRLAMTLDVPPLRERKEDLPQLVRHFLAQHSATNGKVVRDLTPAALRLLSTYEFPGNIRELQNIVERAYILADDDGIAGEEHLPDAIRTPAPAPTSQLLEQGKVHKHHVLQLECQRVKEALARNGGNKTKTARELGIAVKTLYDKIDRFTAEGMW